MPDEAGPAASEKFHVGKVSELPFVKRSPADAFVLMLSNGPVSATPCIRLKNSSAKTISC